MYQLRTCRERRTINLFVLSFSTESIKYSIIFFSRNKSANSYFYPSGAMHADQHPHSASGLTRRTPRFGVGPSSGVPCSAADLLPPAMALINLLARKMPRRPAPFVFSLSNLPCVSDGEVSSCVLGGRDRRSTTCNRVKKMR